MVNREKHLTITRGVAQRMEDNRMVVSPWLRAPEACAYLNISRPQLDKLNIESSVLGRHGGKYAGTIRVYHVDKLDEYLRTQ